MGSLVLRKMYCVGKYDTASYYFHTILAYMLVSCSNIIAITNLIRLKIQWYSTTNLLNIIEALLLEIVAE